MHKFFAKTLFLGKKVFFLPQCHSTNDFISDLNRDSSLIDGTVVWTDHQIKGKGQRGNGWESLPGKNLLASVYVQLKWLNVRDQYLLTFLTGLALREVIQRYVEVEVVVKWPNDVYVGTKKVAGILCEGTIMGSIIESAIIGFGINVNQREFSASNAVSMLSLGSAETVIDREMLLEEVLQAIERRILSLKSAGRNIVLEEYVSHLMSYQKLQTFSANSEFRGKIIGVDVRGYLLIEIAESTDKKLKVGTIQSFGLKEINMIL